MCYINFQITKGATREQKARIVQKIDDEKWGGSGVLIDDFRKQ